MHIRYSLEVYVLCGAIIQELHNHLKPIDPRLHRHRLLLRVRQMAALVPR